MKKSAEKSGVAFTLLPLLVAWGCDGEPMKDDPIDHDESTHELVELESSSRPLRLEDPHDVQRRAELAIDARIAARPQDAIHRETLVRWKAEQILLDDMSEGSPLEDDYGFAADGARVRVPTDSHQHQEEAAR